jgi:signal transduction histidine kinase
MAADLQSDANDALEQLRDLARGIYPPLLADQGLVAALEAQARRASVATSVRSDGIGRYPRDTEAAVYFCVLEALNNVAKYSGATRAEVGLSQTDGELRFAVTDDGAGFDTEETSYGTGLQGMADRLDAIGGALAIVSRRGEGTTIEGRVPAGEVPRDAADAADART